MKRVFLLLLPAAFIALQADSAVADPWVQIITNGFGDTNNEGVGWVQNFNGSIYVALDRATGSTGGAVIIRSSDLTNWSWVVGPGTATVLSDTVTEIIRITAGTNDFYFGTHDSAQNPARVYHSTDGTSWSHITTVGNGYAPSGNSSIGGLAVLGTNLFTATVNNNGGQIWRSRLDGVGYVKMADFSNGFHIGTGANTNINFISYLYAATNNILYASTGHLSNGVPAPPHEGFLYQSGDGGSSWTTNSGVGLCFGDTNNWHIACMLEFRGCLYAAINNSAEGGQLWRTADGTNWVEVLSNGINDARSVELHHLSVDNGVLWVATLPAPGFADEVWRSSNGTNFTQSCLPGFGDADNASRYPSVGGLGSNEFFGVRNLATGAQVWQLGPIIDSPTMQISPATNNLLLAWPELALGFNLETATNLASPVAWLQSTNAPLVTNSQQSVSVTATSGGGFHRLCRP